MDPASGDDGGADQAVLVVQIERKRDGLTVMSKQVTSDLCSGGSRIIDPPREDELCIRNLIRMHDGYRSL
ncbi:MAG TPA: hypothetical protein VNF24_06395 [Candidatus Acidoferrales bacterium]|nr:hypothetical protein [Candidatus Acidoferrales bacterium]